MATKPPTSYIINKQPLLIKYINLHVYDHQHLFWIWYEINLSLNLNRHSKQTYLYSPVLVTSNELYDLITIVLSLSIPCSDQ